MNSLKKKKEKKKQYMTEGDFLHITPLHPPYGISAPKKN